MDKENRQFIPDSSREIEKPKKILAGMPEYFMETEGKEFWKNDTHPIYLMMNLDTKCSNSCVKCALHNTKHHPGPPLTTEQRIGFLKQTASPLNLKELVIIGYGEPSEDFEKVKPIVEEAKKQNIGTVMFTTLQFLTWEQAEFFRDNNVTIMTSIDTADPETYDFLVKPNKQKAKGFREVLENLNILRQVYGKPKQTASGDHVVRLGINTTVCRQNVQDLEKIKALAGDDMIFVANPPMRRGNLTNKHKWEILVGKDYELLQRRAQEVSETGGHSSLAEGSCSYLNRGISIDIDGELLTCGYASDTAHSIGNINSNLTPEQLLEVYKKNRAVFEKYRQETGDKSTCPLRCKSFEKYCREIALAHGQKQIKNPFRILN